MQINPGANLLLKGMVGSTAFGLNNKDSDQDFLGMYAAPTTMFHGLGAVQESFVFKNPDTSYHEVGKYCRLALKCNPTILDLLWLDQYNLRTSLGTELIMLRKNFLSRKYVRDAYFGYATQQLVKLKNRKTELARPAKHARHMLRLLHQGFELYSTGTYSVKLEDPEIYINFGLEVGEQKNFALADSMLERYRVRFDTVKSPLSDTPNAEPIEAWLLKVRHELYQYQNQDVTMALAESEESLGYRIQIS
jgi:uncharacterized protein